MVDVQNKKSMSVVFGYIDQRFQHQLVFVRQFMIYFVLRGLNYLSTHIEYSNSSKADERKTIYGKQMLFLLLSLSPAMIHINLISCFFSKVAQFKKISSLLCSFTATWGKRNIHNTTVNHTTTAAHCQSCKVEALILSVQCRNTLQVMITYGTNVFSLVAISAADFHHCSVGVPVLPHEVANHHFPLSRKEVVS